MNITGVTQTAQILPPNQAVPQSPAAQNRVQGQGQNEDSATGADAIGARMEASIQVMNMEQNSFEDAANQLLDQMAAFTGVGQNINMTA